MSSQYTEAILELVAELSLSEFVARTRGMFFVTAENAEDLPTGFRTNVVEFTSSSPRGLGNKFDILPVKKNESGPFSERISVGRARNCDIVMRHPSVSKLHAHVRQTANGLQLTDLRSKNGTRVNGETLAPDLPRPIEVGDALHFGSVQAILADAEALYEMLH